MQTARQINLSTIPWQGESSQFLFSVSSSPWHSKLSRFLMSSSPSSSTSRSASTSTSSLTSPSSLTSTSSLTSRSSETIFCLIWNPDPQLAEHSLQSDQVHSAFWVVVTPVNRKIKIIKLDNRKNKNLNQQISTFCTWRCKISYTKFQILKLLILGYPPVKRLWNINLSNYVQQSNLH